MSEQVQQLQQSLSEEFGNQILATKFEHQQLELEIDPKAIKSVAQTLEKKYKFTQLIDLCAVDYLGYGKVNWDTETVSATGFGRGVFDDFEPDEANQNDLEQRRFAVVYQLLCMNNNQRLRLKVFPTDVVMPRVDSVISIWNSANWYEREAFDLFGIIFDGHPDLRRILTDYGFVGHPLRKDFPLEGKLEVGYSLENKKVEYRPVSIENRINNPRVIRKKD